MKTIITPEVKLINLRTNNIVTTSLGLGVDPVKGSNTMDAPARMGVFDTPAAPAAESGNSIWQ